MMGQLHRSLWGVVILTLLIVGISPVAPASASVFSCGSNGSYTVDANNVVTGNSDCEGDLTIDPSVVEIASDAFQSALLGDIVIPGSVLVIRNGAFRYATATTLTLSEGLLQIEAHAFRQMTGSRLDINLPDTLTTLGGSAFENSYLGNVTIGSSLETIESQTFYNNFGVGAQSLTVRGNALRTVGFASFQGLSNTVISLPEGVTTVAGRAFEGAGATSEIYLPSTLTSVGVDAFNYTNPSFVIYCGTAPDVQNCAYPLGVVPQCASVASFRGNGPWSGMSPQLVTPGVRTNLIPNTIVYNGFAFQGWATHPDGSGTTFADEAEYDFSSHITLYAQWLALPLVRFHANGGTGGMSDQASASPAQLTPNAFSRCQATFDGWNTEFDGTGMPYSDEQEFPFDVPATELYAQWNMESSGPHTVNADFTALGAISGNSAFTERIWAIEIDPESGDVYVGGSFANVAGNNFSDFIVRWDGTSWHNLGDNGIGDGSLHAGSSPTEDGVRDIAISANGDVYITGNFVISGVAEYVARWDGDQWYGLGSATAVNAAGFSLALAEDGDVYVAGAFHDVAGITQADYVARWDGSAWSALGNISSGTQFGDALLTVALGINETVYVGGNFGELNGESSIAYIAKWNGTSWSGVGNTLGRQTAILWTVNDITVDTRSGSDVVYVSSLYPVIFNVGTNSYDWLGHLLKWDGQTWSRGFSDVVFRGYVQDVEVTESGVVVAGYFVGTGTTYNDVCNPEQRYVVFNDGQRTSAFATSTGGYAFGAVEASTLNYGFGIGADALAVGLDGRLYVGGAFLNAQGNPSADWITVSNLSFNTPDESGGGNGGDGSTSGGGESGGAGPVDSLPQSVYQRSSVVSFMPVEDSAVVNNSNGPLVLSQQPKKDVIAESEPVPSSSRQTPPPSDGIALFGLASGGIFLAVIAVIAWRRRSRMN